MFIIIKNIKCFSPESLGIKDIVVAGDKIIKISDPEQFTIHCEQDFTIDGSGLMAFPGIIDGHVHIIGGGGEEGFTSRIGEIDSIDILDAGITTVVGLLGADDQTKSLYSLLAKAKSLEAEGISTYIYSGSYSVPVVTFTGDITKDMIIIDKVIGAGEIALSDHRSSNPSIQELLALGSKIHIGGMLGGKPGLLHIHMGDGKEGLTLLNQIIQKSNLPKEMFLPTHVNRNQALFEQAISYAKSGGNIDLTSGEKNGICLPDAVEQLMKSGIDMQKVTVSSDANGSIPCGGIGEIQTLFDDVIDCITKKNICPETIIPLVTENAAKRLTIYSKKGALFEGSDADIMILNKDYKLEMLFSMGKLKLDNRRRNCHE